MIPTTSDLDNLFSRIAAVALHVSKDRTHGALKSVQLTIGDGGEATVAACDSYTLAFASFHFPPAIAPVLPAVLAPVFASATEIHVPDAVAACKAWGKWRKPLDDAAELSVSFDDHASLFTVSSPGLPIPFHAVMRLPELDFPAWRTLVPDFMVVNAIEPQPALASHHLAKMTATPALVYSTLGVRPTSSTDHVRLVHAQNPLKPVVFKQTILPSGHCGIVSSVLVMPTRVS